MKFGNTHAGMLCQAVCLGGGLLLCGCQTPVPPPAPVSAPSGPPQALPSPPVQPQSRDQQTAGPLRPGQNDAYMDRMESGLRGLLRGSAIRVMRQANELVVVLPVRRMLAGMMLTPGGQKIVHDLARALRFYNHTTVQINGYTDTYGSFEDNVFRSQRYAGLMMGALAREGVPESRMQSHGFGQTELQVPTGENVRDSRNNRVVLVISPQP